MTQGMLFDTGEPPGPVDQRPQFLAPGAWLMRGVARAQAPALLDAIRDVTRQAPLRQMTTPGGGRMSVGMSGCGARAWISDATGYRYEARDPLTGKDWPPMPGILRELARDCASRAGYDGFCPDSCLINRYRPGDRMGLHQDRDERRDVPIVSVSLGVSAVFLWGTPVRSDGVRRLVLNNGDVVVWGGPSRLAWHGVAPLPQAYHTLSGEIRYNLTFRVTA